MARRAKFAVADSLPVWVACNWLSQGQHRGEGGAAIFLGPDSEGVAVWNQQARPRV